LKKLWKKLKSIKRQTNFLRVLNFPILFYVYTKDFNQFNTTVTTSSTGRVLKKLIYKLGKGTFKNEADLRCEDLGTNQVNLKALKSNSEKTALEN